MHDLDRTQIGSSSMSSDSRRPKKGSGLNGDYEMQLAADLMELETEEEFENFLGDLISQGAQAAGKFINSPTGQALGGVLKDAAKQLLPVAGQAVGTYFGGPAGGQIGGALGSGASNLFEAEAEADEQEWEAANVFVKVAVDAVNNAANAPAGAHPEAVAQNVVAEALRRYAPHVADTFSNGRGEWAEAPRRSNRSGRWVRHHNKIILLGV